MSLWRNRDYMLLWSGQSISAVGSRASSIVFPLLVLDLTHSAAQAGLVGALFALPYALVGLPAGALVDRWNRKRVMLLCDTVRALNMLSIPLAMWIGHLTVAQIGVVAFLEGTLFTFYDVAQGASLPRVVSAEQLPAAMARSHGMVGIAGLLGPPIGGALYQVRRSLPFIADAISFAASVVSLLFVTTELQEERSEVPRRLHVEILEGLGWIQRQPLIRFTGIIMATNGMVFTGLTLIMIILAKQQHAAPSTIGLMFAIASVGGTAGSFMAAGVAKRFTFPQILIGLLWINVLLWPLYLIVSSPVLLGVLTGFLWMLSGPAYVSAASYRRILLPDELQGRVNSVFELGELGADAVSIAICGVLIQGIGVRPTLLVLLTGLVVQAAVTTLNSHVRHAPPIGTLNADGIRTT